ncbi:hypothetical protein JYU34_018778 [Plutella xylostella]|uniref:Uncharacterized protein n=1 Tax=Plutella xylostella TaxID=51655 RepID=A0ABQ7PYF8_PLUXY|nr:hypothetical protein JYU34_018778 [Plutella xylostella]
MQQHLLTSPDPSALILAVDTNVIDSNITSRMPRMQACKGRHRLGGLVTVHLVGRAYLRARAPSDPPAGPADSGDTRV